MAWWWRTFTSKKAKKEKKGKSSVDKIQLKIKLSCEEKCNDKSIESKRHSIDTIPKKKSRPQKVPSRSISLSTIIIICSKINARMHHTHPLSLPLLELHNHLTSKLGSTRASKPRHVSKRKEPIALLSSSSNDNNSDIIIHDPLSSSSHGNKITSVACNDKLLTTTTTTQKSLIPSSTTPTPQLCNNEILPKLSKKGVTQLQNLQIIPRRSGFWSPTKNTIISSSRSPTRRTFGHDQHVLNSGFCSSKPYPDIDSWHYSSLRSVHNIGHDLFGGDLKRDVFWTHNRCNLESSPISSSRKISPNLNSRIQSEAVTPLHPLATHNGLLFPTSYSTVQASSPHSPGSGILTRPSKWKKGRFLGQGTFGQVFVGFNSDSGLICAMKEVTLCPDDPKSVESAKQLRQEVALLSNLRHPNIVRFYGSEMVGDKLYIYLEYAAGGSIYTLLQQYGQLGESAIRSYTRQILSGLAYLHAKCIVHRDIKGANILVDPNGTVKLADFGMAKYIGRNPCQFSLKGSPHWMAPEIIINPSRCNVSVDIWSLGCTILEMATTKPPWSQYEGVAAMFKLGNTEEIPLVPDYLSEEGKDFVNLCLQRDPQCRPSASQLLLHPFVKNFKLERSIQGIGPYKLDSYLHSKASDINLSRNSSGSRSFSHTHIINLH
ncbi:PREDICTED: mitogen-activated protein kinase kinase kinase YODA-like [Lupinus angustifolius]|uniref:mitogen-activated protein kinase kinase kinase YODA-like n=1 Tax=Lupinus angustifolius TaxID=3871 RepID=UPI00092F0C2D|nr:PREDICTED: mitogen-activated protein kinase kinase kinase YODA-like [Lupinus angustifolius]